MRYSDFHCLIVLFEVSPYNLVLVDFIVQFVLYCEIAMYLVATYIANILSW